MGNFKPANGSIAIAPSILSADLWQLGKQIQQVQAAGADWLHIDIMDAHFVPNLSFGPCTVTSIKNKTTLAQDVHLMVEYPEVLIEPFIKAGAANLTLHIESKGDIPALLKLIKQHGISAGISIKPDTPPSMLLPYMDLIDLVLVMTVYPGFGGQGFLNSSPAQITAVRHIIKDSRNPIWLEVDGGINAQTAPMATSAGADALVAGNAIFGQTDIAKALKNIRERAILV